MKRLALAIVAVLAAGCSREGRASPAWIAAASAIPLRAPPKAASAPPTGFLKGQLHAHTSGSGDSDAPLDEVLRFYATHGYDFVVVTDHNRVTPLPPTAPLLALPGVEITANLARCDPPPEQRGCLLHVNALAVTAPEMRDLPALAPIPRRVDVYAAEIAAARAMGGVAQLNHPNFRWAARADDLVELAGRGLALVEIENRSDDAQNEGDAAHPSTEALWDAALLRGARVFASATDDAHDYGRVDAYTGARTDDGDRGFVVVRAARDPASVRDALARGDFYASTGVVLEELVNEPARVVVEGGEELLFQVIADGRVVREERGHRLAIEPRALGSKYVRVRASGAGGRRAFTQPVFL